MSTVAALAGERSPPSPWRLAVLGTSAAGLLSGLRIFVTYQARGVDISALDGIASGLMCWWLWIPCVPGILWLARRLDPSRGRALRVLALHAALGGVVSLAQLSLFSLLSGALRTLRYGLPFRFDLASPLSALLAPGFLVYGGLVALGWWWSGRGAPASGTRPERPLRFQAGKQLLFLPAGEIDWVAAAGNYLELHTATETHLVRETLKSVHARLGTGPFVRVHRSTLVRLDAIRRLVSKGDEACVVLRDGTELPVGRTYRAELARLVP